MAGQDEEQPQLAASQVGLLVQAADAARREAGFLASVASAVAAEAPRSAAAARGGGARPTRLGGVLPAFSGARPA
eukprot:11217496-Lingulodinium_polyedra.AAC.1